jgi:3'-phosphoadenosine 5'-phosphosulfate sulfotransferase (PAPS reductase)/FAD synthetase
MQAAPLSVKVALTKQRIRDWVEYWGEDHVYISFSGGKDSTVLLHLVRSMYPDIPAVFSDTGLEFPEIREFVRTFDNVVFVKPKMTFKQVIEKYGYPMISKEVAECVYGARKYLTSVLQSENVLTDRRYQYRLDQLLGTGEFSNKPEAVSVEDKIRMALDIANGRHSKERQRSWRRFGLVTGTFTKGNTINKEIYTRVKADDRSMYSCSKYKFFLAAPFEIANQCCSVMKKTPMKKYAKETGRHPITGQMASESRLRTQKWLNYGCNAYDLKEPISDPMSAWFEEDVLLYAKQNNIQLAPVYGEIVRDDETQFPGQMNMADFGIFDDDRPALKTTGCNRTGCVFCGFGCHRDKRPNRFELIDKVSNPKLRDYCMRGGAFTEEWLWKPDNRGLGMWFVLQWINVHGGFNIAIPEYERYAKEYGTEETEWYLKKRIRNES